MLIKSQTINNKSFGLFVSQKSSDFSVAQAKKLAFQTNYGRIIKG
nr:hypothetical protein [Okeania sp. SIO2F4]